MSKRMLRNRGWLVVAAAASSFGCSPVVRVEAPREPITINLNVKLDADVRVKLEDQAKKDVAKNPDIF
jgi:Holliday junction resolvase